MSASLNLLPLSEVRKEEIQKLINFIKPNIKKRMKRKTFLHARSASSRLNVTTEDFTQEILDASGFYFKEGSEQPQQKQSPTSSTKLKDLEKELGI